MVAAKQSPEQFLVQVTNYGFGISAASSVPLYLQLYMILQRGIRERALEAGDRFPSEEAIAAHFDVSRPTANRAVQELIDQGWLVRQRGRGTFVQESAPPQLSLLNTSLSFSDQIGRERDHRTRFIKRAVVEATQEEAAALGIEEGDSLCYIRRLHSVGNRIVMVCDSKLPAARFPQLEKMPFAENSLFVTLRERFGCVIQRAERCAEAAVVLDAEIAELIGVPLFSPVLLLSGLAFDQEDRLAEMMTAYVKEGVLFKNVITADVPHEEPTRDVCPRTRAPKTKPC